MALNDVIILLESHYERFKFKGEAKVPNELCCKLTAYFGVFKGD